MGAYALTWLTHVASRAVTLSCCHIHAQPDYLCLLLIHLHVITGDPISDLCAASGVKSHRGQAVSADVYFA